jgi:hypothetical protein
MVNMRDHIARGIDTMFEIAGDDALYAAAGSPSGVSVRIIVSQPDEEISLGQLDLRVDTIVADVRISEVPDLANGDTFTIGDETFVVKGKDRDPLRLIWTVDLR